MISVRCTTAELPYGIHAPRVCPCSKGTKDELQWTFAECPPFFLRVGWPRLFASVTQAAPYHTSRRRRFWRTCWPDPGSCILSLPLATNRTPFFRQRSPTSHRHLVFLSSLPKGGLLHIDLGRFRLALIDRLFVAGDLESVSFRALRSRFLAAGALSNSPPSILSIVRGASCLTIFPCPFCSTAALRVASFGSVPLGKSQRVVHSQWAPSSHSVLPGSSPRQGVVQGGYGGLFSGDHRAGGWWGEDRRPTRSGSPAPRFVGLLQLSLWKPGPAIGLSTYKGCAPWLR